MTAPDGPEPGAEVPDGTGPDPVAPDGAAPHGEHELEQEVAAEGTLLARAIGGWRGMIDSGLPALVFVVVYLVGDALNPAIWAALGAGALLAVLRLLRRESLQQVIAGFAGVAVSAWLASRTGNAEDFFLPGLLINVVYLAAFLISILVRWPLLGFVVGALTGDLTRWRRDPDQRRAYGAASWIWVGVFGLRLLVQVPMYLAGAVGALGIAKIVLGWPLYLLGAYLTYRVLAPVLSARRAQDQADGATAAEATIPDAGPEADQQA